MDRRRALAGASWSRTGLLGEALCDVVLPGDMKESHELGHRGAEGSRGRARHVPGGDAAMRSQANTARLMEQNPTLMRLREIEAP